MKHICRQCKSWVVITDYHGRDTKYRTCDHSKVQLGYQSRDTIETDGVRIENDEGWGWIVGPEFGCVHFTPRTPPIHTEP